jgi:hypothetical protein
MKSNSANEALLHLRRFLQIVHIHFVLELMSEKVKNQDVVSLRGLVPFQQKIIKENKSEKVISL